MTTYKDPLSKYVSELFAPEDRALRRAREDSNQRGLPAINVRAEEGRFLQFLARASGGRKAVEIGTLGGYSGIWIVRGLVEGGRLITLEKDRQHAEVAQEHFVAAGLEQQVEVRTGNAHDLLEALHAEGPFDFVFIDAEKLGYEDYFDWALENVRIGGMIAAHNAFRGGSVTEENSTDENTRAIQVVNRRIAGEPRLISTIYPAGDGTLIAIRVS